jgi:hypothetical protein
VFLNGRLLKITERVPTQPFPGRAAAEPGEDDASYIDGQYRWRVDERYVADDVATAMLAQGGERP